MGEIQMSRYRIGKEHRLEVLRLAAAGELNNDDHMKDHLLKCIQDLEGEGLLRGIVAVYHEISFRLNLTARGYAYLREHAGHKSIPRPSLAGLAMPLA
jgi:hypothetical protein